jgi:hypothetical protein
MKDVRYHAGAAPFRGPTLPANNPADPLAHASLKARHRAARDGFDPGLNLRVHRALSWLDRADQLAAQDDPDGQVIFLWIAFNAAYATDIDDRALLSEQDSFRAFISALLSLDARERHLERLVWKEFPGSIRMLLDNRYVFPPFWDFQKGILSETAWQKAFEEARATAHRALGDGNTERVLAVVLSRVYTLRNQLVHGGATWNGSVNREQVRDTARFLARLVPLTLSLMMDHPRKTWSNPAYPVVS